MVPVTQLQFARKYPFSSIARSVVKQVAPDLTSLDPKSFDSAFALIEASASTSPKDRKVFLETHFSKRELSYPEFLVHDVVAFPLAKILISFTRNPALYSRFAGLMGDLTFEYVSNERDRVGIILDLSHELNVKMDLVNGPFGPRFRIPLSSYLAFPFTDGQLHLIHQPVRKGNVELELNGASRWLAEGVHALVLSTLPVDVRGLPPLFGDMASRLQGKLSQRRAEESKLSAANGIVLTAFPPCMEKLHSEITSGVNLPHMARFDLATFLVNINMPFEDIVSVFSKASNYDERITRYHLDNLSGRVSGKKYSSPACAKVREHGLCISRTCNVTHPLQFYKRESESPTPSVETSSQESSEKKEN